MPLTRWTCLVLCTLAAGPAVAAEPKIDAAIKTIVALGNDPAKLKTFCAMSKAMTDEENEKDATKVADIDKQVDGFMQALGPEFQSAWNAGEELSPETADGKEYYGALDALNAKCGS